MLDTATCRVGESEPGQFWSSGHLREGMHFQARQVAYDSDRRIQRSQSISRKREDPCCDDFWAVGEAEHNGHLYTTYLLRVTFALFCVGNQGRVRATWDMTDGARGIRRCHASPPMTMSAVSPQGSAKPRKTLETEHEHRPHRIAY